jgi:hypothetical protein
MDGGHRGGAAVDYIRRVDELLAPPAYRLGMDDAAQRFELNTFTLVADPAKLNQILDEHLNKALKPPGFQATDESGVTAGVRYWTAVERVVVSFIRYWRAESSSAPATGWMSYTEVLIGFYVARALIGSDRPDELFFYVATVNIDDSNYQGQLQDPHTLPIVLGREAYGLPKNPGQIFYRPKPHDPNGAKLQVWDVPSGGGRYHLADAIVVDPGMPEASRVDPPAPTSLPQASGGRVDPDDPARWRILASCLDMTPEDLVDRLHRPTYPIFERHSFRRGARLLEMPAPWETKEVVVWSDLLFHVQLVGLKQFLDPTHAFTLGLPMGACYRAIVESPLEENPDHPWPAPDSITNDQEILFPQIDRIDLLATFGIPAVNRKVTVGVTNMTYQRGQLLFARPERTKVWTPL